MWRCFCGKNHRRHSHRSAKGQATSSSAIKDSTEESRAIPSDSRNGVFTNEAPQLHNNYRTSGCSSYVSARSDSFGSVISSETSMFQPILETGAATGSELSDMQYQGHKQTSSETGNSSRAAEDLIRSAEAANAEGRALQVERDLRSAAELSGTTLDHMFEVGFVGSTGVASSLDLTKVQQNLAALHTCLEAAQDVSDFHGSIGEDMSIVYRHHKGEKLHSFRFEATYSSPVVHIAAMTREFDLLTTWNKYSRDSTILGEPSNTESVLYTAQWMPFPLTELDLVIHAQWSDVLEEHGALVFTLRDFSDQLPCPGIAELPPHSAKRRRIHLLPGSSSILQPLPCTADGKPRTRCLVVANIDPHIDYIPQVVLTFVFKVLSPVLYQAATKMLQTYFSSPEMQLPRRIAESPDVYQRIDHRFSSPPYGTNPRPAIGKLI